MTVILGLCRLSKNRPRWRGLLSYNGGRCGTICSKPRTRPPERAPEPAAPTYGRYGVLRDEVPGEDICNIDGDDGDPMEDFGINPRQGKQ